MSKDIKWGIIQPLTGGMYYGARAAVGKPADWIISYPGLSDVKKDKDGNLTTVGNEYNLLKWLKDHNELPPYQVFDKAPFQETDLNVALKDVSEWSTTPVDYSNTDLVVSVPVCSGLSMATPPHTSQETRDTRNCNMVWNARFALEKIKPKVYIFENAPLLFADRGKKVRESINAIAKEYGYSVTYYKTDTKLHDNCQCRPRTFVVFIKQTGDKKGNPEFNYEKVTVGIKEYLDRIPKDATQQEPLEMRAVTKIFLDFLIDHYGDDFRKKVKTCPIDNIISENLFDEALKYADSYTKDSYASEKLRSFITHVKTKTDQGLGFYSYAPKVVKTDTLPAVYFKTMMTILHDNENRLYSTRELLHLMGMPHDYEMAGQIKINYPKIGQNVPARTAQWITSEAVRFIENWDKLDRPCDEVLFVDNIKQKSY